MQNDHKTTPKGGENKAHQLGTSQGKIHQGVPWSFFFASNTADLEQKNQQPQTLRGVFDNKSPTKAALYQKTRKEVAYQDKKLLDKNCCTTAKYQIKHCDPALTRL